MCKCRRLADRQMRPVSATARFPVVRWKRYILLPRASGIESSSRVRCGGSAMSTMGKCSAQNGGCAVWCRTASLFVCASCWKAFFPYYVVSHALCDYALAMNAYPWHLTTHSSAVMCRHLLHKGPSGLDGGLKSSCAAGGEPSRRFRDAAPKMSRPALVCTRAAMAHHSCCSGARSLFIASRRRAGR